MVKMKGHQSYFAEKPGTALNTSNHNCIKLALAEYKVTDTGKVYNTVQYSALHEEAVLTKCK